jgi:hypothetical protein
MTFGDDILSMHLQVKYAQPIRRTLCPICWWPLIETERGLKCTFCTWHESPAPMKFVPRVPDNPQS